MDIKLLKKVEKKFSKFNMDISYLDNNNIKRYILCIEKYFTECEEDIKKACILLNNINLSVRGICEKSGVSKSTVYKEPHILFDYIKNRQAEGIEDVEIIKKSSLKRLYNERNEMRRLLDKSMISEIEFMNLKYENESMKTELKELYKHIEILEQERITYLRDNEKLKLLKNKKVVDIVSEFIRLNIDEII